MTENTHPSISVVIPTYNRRQRLLDCINSVLEAGKNYEGKYEIIVVDDCSTVDIKNEIWKNYVENPNSKCANNIKFVQNKTRKMTAYSRNAGLWAAECEWVFFLDNDNVVCPDIFTEFAKCIETKPCLGLVVALTYNIPENRIWTLGGDINWLTMRFKENSPKLLGKARTMTDLDKLELPETYPTTANAPNAVFVRKDVLQAVGGYNTAYKICYEDVDLALRVFKAGYPAVVCTTTRTKHIHVDETSLENPELRALGISWPDQAYCLVRNRYWLAKYLAPGITRFVYFALFSWIPGTYYAVKALKHKRFDVAKAVIKGMFAGLFTSAPACKFN